uniref:Uncharacterized protein n=1 Tax=Panagrolaimus sp. JU765 TaxID=591449 RepID=A0AC34Q3W5_9BILA
MASRLGCNCGSCKHVYNLQLLEDMKKLENQIVYGRKTRHPVQSKEPAETNGGKITQYLPMSLKILRIHRKAVVEKQSPNRNQRNGEITQYIPMFLKNLWIHLKVAVKELRL